MFDFGDLSVKGSATKVRRHEYETVKCQSLTSVWLHVRLPMVMFGKTLETNRGVRNLTID